MMNSFIGLPGTFDCYRNTATVGEEYPDIPFTSKGGRIKVWLSGAWTPKPVKVWNGSAWVTKLLKYWNGSAWVITPY